MRKAILIVVAIVVVIAVFSKRYPKSSYKPGTQALAPGFALQDLEGRPLDLSASRGKVVLLDFWATWCTPCRDEIPHFVQFQNQYRNQGFQVIGISMDDDAQPVRTFYQQFNMNYPVALGNAKLAESYGGVLGLPVTFLINRDGRIAAKYVGATDMTTVEHEVQSLLQSK